MLAMRLRRSRRQVEETGVWEQRRFSAPAPICLSSIKLVNKKSEGVSRVAGSLDLNGESWRDKDTTTYTSILDMYQTSDLFSEEKTEQYSRISGAEAMEQQWIDFLFSGQFSETSAMDQEFVDYIFAEKLEFTALRDYSRTSDDFLAIGILSGILVMMLFLMGMLGYNGYRRKRRAAYAAEIDMED